MRGNVSVTEDTGLVKTECWMKGTYCEELEPSEVRLALAEFEEGMDMRDESERRKQRRRVKRAKTAKRRLCKETVIYN